MIYKKNGCKTLKRQNLHIDLMNKILIIFLKCSRISIVKKINNVKSLWNFGVGTQCLIDINQEGLSQTCSEMASSIRRLIIFRTRIEKMGLRINLHKLMKLTRHSLRLRLNKNMTENSKIVMICKIYKISFLNITKLKTSWLRKIEIS